MAVPATLARANHGGDYSKWKQPFQKYFFSTVAILFQDQSRAYDSKKNCWVPDPEEGYVEAIITKTAGDNVTVSIGQGTEVRLSYSE